MRSPPIGIVIGVFLTIALGVQSARRPRVVSLPMPTSETIPYVAEVMGATSYEEVVEEEDKYINGNKRVQRKLNVQSEGERELDPEHPDYQEYQGNKTRVMGRPGVDFPVLPNIPRTEFSCRKVKKSGYYADLDTGCQVFHICDGGRKISFLCPNGTIFRQSHLICDWWFRVDCERSVELYDESAEQLAHDQMIYKKRAEEIARAMKTTTTALPTTERSSNFRHSRRKNERPSSKLIDLSPANQGSLTGNQISETFVDNRGAFTKTNQATNAFPPSDEGKLVSAQPPAFGYNANPTAQPSSISYSEQRSTHIVQEQKTIPSDTHHPIVVGGSYNTQDFSAAPSGPQNTYQQPPVNTNPTGEQVYQQANADSNNLGLSTANPPINNFQQETGNTNYKFSYTASAVGQSSSSSIGAPKDFTNNQVFSQQTAYHQEKESQIPAETASFGSSRHRFANQLEQGYQNDYPNINVYTATSTTTSTEIPSTSTVSTSTYNAGPSNHQSGSTIYNQNGGTNYNGVGSPSFTNHGTSTFSSAGTTSYSNGESSYNGGGSTAYNTVSSPSYNSDGTTYSAGSANYNSPGTTSYKEAASTTYQAGTNDYRYQTIQSTILSTRAPPTTKPVNRGSFKHHNSKSHQISQQQLQYQQTSAPYTTSTLVPSSSQVYNSHMQPYSSLNQESQLANNKHADHPTWKATPSAPAYSTGKDIYRGESSSQGFSTYNSYTTGQSSPAFNSLSQVKESPSSTAKPYRGKTVFNVKIRPSKEDYSLLELYRLYPTSSPSSTSGYTSTTVPPFITSERPSSYATYASQPSSYATYPSQPASSHSPASTVYTPNIPQTNTILSTFPSTQHKYATVNITGTPEEIRPENVNSLMDTGIKPTSADALHTFASIYSSAETDSFYESTVRPHISDIVLTLGPSTTEEPTTTIKPLTSTNGEELPSELSKNTKDSYSYLFSDSNEQAESLKDDLTPKESGSAISDLNRTAQKQVNKSSPKTTAKVAETTTIKPQESTPKFRDSSELRELAQVFSRALSAYLEDPETFKEILAQVRPTEPNPSDSTTPNSDDEVLDFSDASQSRTGTTEPPGTTIFNTDDVTADISIGEINNLVSSAKLVEPDISYETNSISPFASQSVADVEFTTPTASPEINIVSSGSSLDYDSKLGSPEDTSYFPTAGGVSDDSRPRYGGFHNNTRRKFNSYSPYGAELRNNVTTGTPITEGTTTSIPSTTSPPYTTTQYTTFETTTLPPPSSILPAAQQVNNLVASHNILYGTSAQFTSSSEEFDPNLNSEEQEKLLQTSGSQSLVSSHNYASFAENFNKQGQKLYGKDTFANYAPSAIAEDPSAISNEYFKGNLLPYFGQEPPFETISVPSAFQTQTPNFGDKILKNRTELNDINTQASVNSYTIDSQNVLTSKGSFDGKNVISDRMGTFGTDSTPSPTWTVGPYETTQYFSSSSVEVSPSGSEFFASSSIKPTTYHPRHPSEVTTVESVQPEATTATPTTTVQDTTTTEAAWPTTMSPENPEYHSLMQAKAKEMFGMLNETAATMLMQVMTQAENNMTLRKLVLLLVDDRTKDKTEEKSRINLINALLTHENDIEEVTAVASTTPVPKKKVMKIMRVRAGSGRSLKFQRGLDTQTAVAGSNSIRNVTEFNKANAAKLYIPSGPAATLKPTTSRPPTTTLAPKLPYDSDARALELLKTLYNLAAKWG